MSCSCVGQLATFSPPSLLYRAEVACSGRTGLRWHYELTEGTATPMPKINLTREGTFGIPGGGWRSRDDDDFGVVLPHQKLPEARIESSRK